MATRRSRTNLFSAPVIQTAHPRSRPIQKMAAKPRKRKAIACSRARTTTVRSCVHRGPCRRRGMRPSVTPMILPQRRSSSSPRTTSFTRTEGARPAFLLCDSRVTSRDSNREQLGARREQGLGEGHRRCAGVHQDRPHVRQRWAPRARAPTMFRVVRGTHAPHHPPQVITASRPRKSSSTSTTSQPTPSSKDLSTIRVRQAPSSRGQRNDQ